MVISRRRFITGVALAVTPLGATASAQEYKAQQAGEGVSDRDGHQRRRRRTRPRGEPGTAGRERGGYHIPLSEVALR